MPQINQNQTNWNVNALDFVPDAVPNHGNSGKKDNFDVAYGQNQSPKSSKSFHEQQPQDQI